MKGIVDLDQVAQIAAQPPQWRDRDGRQHIPMEQWGKDHWSLLAFVENRTVDHKGAMDWNRVTLSRRNWPNLYATRQYGRLTPIEQDSADRYGLRLKRTDPDTPNVLYGHCEGDALMDLVDHGLVTIQMPRPDADGDYFLKPNGQPLTGEDYPSPKFVTGLAELTLMPWAKFALTDTGRHYNDALRAHKATEGATWSNFTPPGPLLLSCSGPGGCTRTTPSDEAVKDGWEQVDGRWYDPQCNADRMDREDYFASKKKG